MTKEDYFKYYIQGTDHYLISKDVFIELFDEMESWKEEAKELKKQLEEKENIACNWKDSCLENAGKIEKLENQQKEFIEYLEEKEKEFDILGDPKNAGACKGILRKYKSIIGVSNENNT